jgi:hypothetical protein
MRWLAAGIALGWMACIAHVKRLILKYGPSGISDDKRARLLEEERRD